MEQPPAPVTMLVDSMLRENEALIRAVHEAQSAGHARESTLYLERLVSNVVRLGKMHDMQTLSSAHFPDRRELRPPPREARPAAAADAMAVTHQALRLGPATPSPFALPLPPEQTRRVRSDDLGGSRAPVSLRVRRIKWTIELEDRLRMGVERLGDREHGTLAEYVGQGVTSEQVRSKLRTWQRARDRQRLRRGPSTSAGASIDLVVATTPVAAATDSTTTSTAAAPHE